MRCSRARRRSRPSSSELTPLLAADARTALRRALVEPAKKRGYRFEDEALVDEMVSARRGRAGGAAAARLRGGAALGEARPGEEAPHPRGLPGDRRRRGRPRPARRGHDGPRSAPSGRASSARSSATSSPPRAPAPSIDREELLSAFPDRPAAEEVLRQLIDARLLTTYEVEGKEGEPSHHRVEVVHESLLKAWPRLVRWQAQDEEGALLRDQLKQAAHLWEEKGRTADLLWTGTAFREFELWRERYPGALTALEEDFARSMADKARRKRRLVRAAAAAVVLVSAGVAIAIAVSRHKAVVAARAGRGQQAAGAGPAEAAGGPDRGARLRDREPGAGRHEGGAGDGAARPSGGAAGVGARRRRSATPGFPRSLRTGAISRWPVTRPRWVSGTTTAAPRFVCRATRRARAVATWRRGPRTELLVTGLGSGNGQQVHVWSLPGGTKLRTIDFGRPSLWQVGPGRLFAETPEGAPVESFVGGGLLRSWRLPDGEPEVLGHVDARKLGITSSFFEPHGRAWLYTKGTTTHLVPLPVDLRSRSGLQPSRGERRALMQFLGPDLLALHDESGENRLLRFPENGPPVTTVVPKPGSAPAEVLADVLRSMDPWPPLGRREAPALGHDRPPGSAAPGAATRGFLVRCLARPRPRGSHRCRDDSRHEPADFLAAASALAQRRRRVQGVSRPLAFSPDSRWLATAAGGQTTPSLASTGHRFQRGQDVRPAARSGLQRDVGHGVRPTGPLPDRRRHTPGTTPGSSPSTAPRFEGSRRTRVTLACVSSRSRRRAATWPGPSTTEGGRRRCASGTSRRAPCASSICRCRSRSQEARPGRRLGTKVAIVSLAFLDDSTLYTAGDGGIRRWNLETGAHVLVKDSGPGAATTMTMSDDRRVAFTQRWSLGGPPMRPSGAAGHGHGCFHSAPPVRGLSGPACRLRARCWRPRARTGSWSCARPASPTREAHLLPGKSAGAWLVRSPRT